MDGITEGKFCPILSDDLVVGFKVEVDGAEDSMMEDDDEEEDEVVFSSDSGTS